MKRLLLVLLAALLPLIFASAADAAPGPPQAPQWWFDTWKVQQLWNMGATGQGVIIGEIDTGVNGQLSELSANVLPGIDFGELGGDGLVDRDMSKKDPDFGHGSAMASLMVAQEQPPTDIAGVAKDAKVLPIAVPIGGTADRSSTDFLPEAIRWAVKHNAKIINLSLGAQQNQNSAAQQPCPSDEQDAINYAISKGAIVVAASGNEGKHGSPVEDPGVCLGVVSVGSVNQAGVVAADSSRHPYLTLTAPGVNIPSLGKVNGVVFRGEGTSQATALTSAAMALVWSKYPSLSNRELVARVLATLDNKRQTRDPAYGYGILDPYRAVTEAVPADAPNPVYQAVAPFLNVGSSNPALSRPAPAATSPSPPGEFAIGGAPTMFTKTLRWGTGLIVAGLAALIVLCVVALRRHRRREAAAFRTAIPREATLPPAPGSPEPTWQEITPWPERSLHPE